MRPTLRKFVCEGVDTSGTEPVLRLRVRRWFRWRTERWVRVPKQYCGGCHQSHDWWVRSYDAAALPCAMDFRLSRLFYAQTNGSLEPLMPDNVVPLHRGGVYR